MTVSEREMQDFNSHLWQKFRNGDIEAFGRLSELNYKALYNYALRFSRDTEFIKDCIQDLYLDLWERRSHLSQTAFVKPYLMKALRHRIIKESLYLKRFREPESIPFELNESEPSLENMMIDEEHLQAQINQVKQSINQLTRRQKEIIYLRYYQDMSYEEIAMVMNISKPSVATLHYRTLMEMKKQKIIRDLFMFLFIVMQR